MDEKETKIKEAIDAIRPSLQDHGGDVAFISLKDNLVTVSLQGHCVGCMYSQMTLKDGLERYLKQTVDENLIVENDVPLTMPEF